MAFLGSIGKTISSALTQVKQGNLTGAVSTVLTKQASIIPAPKIFQNIARDVTIPLAAQFGPAIVAGSLGAGGLSGLSASASGFASNPASLFTPFLSGGRSLSGGPMALNIGQLLGGLGGIFGGPANAGTAIGTIGQVASLASGFFPSPQMSQVVQMQATPVMAMAPMIRQAAGSLTREIFDAGAKVLTRLGIPVGASAGSFTSALKRSLSSIASLARRTPSGTMVSVLVGLGLTAFEANTLTAWHAQRKKGRRMNPTNPRALRRAARRIKSFHKMCTTTDLIRTRSNGRRSTSCGTCKKKPCRC